MRGRNSQHMPKGTKRRRPATGSTPSKKTKTVGKADSMLRSSGVIPEWLSPEIPYSAWVDIFHYAAAGGGSIDNTWLVHAATTCRAFLEPAMTALYRCPTPSSATKAKKLLACLERPSTDNIMINYRLKVESLHINVDFFSATAMALLAVRLPRLKELIAFSRFDQPPYRDLDKATRWTYLPAGFTFMAQPSIVSREVLGDTAEDPSGSEHAKRIFASALNPSTLQQADLHPVVLKSWEWSGRFFDSESSWMTLDKLPALHEASLFAQLTRISFTNIQIPSLKKSIPSDEAAAHAIFAEDDRVIDTVASSIQKLNQLKHLVFESSTIVSDRLLSRLPRDLVCVQLINCWEVTSDHFAKFLGTHGSQLRFLTLNHNQSLDLAFLTDLATSCPNLEELCMNMSYYRLHDSINDSDPLYDQALLPGQVPLWPSSLRVIEIDHIRQWSIEAAEMFLQSLIDGAPNLPNLRHLTIKTMLDVPWQRRAEMRKGWRERFDAVFLRPWVPPKMHVGLRDEEATGPPVISDASPKKKRKKEEEEPTRRSGRIASHVSDSDRHSSRLRSARTKGVYVDPDTDADELSSDEAPSEGGESPRGEMKPSKDRPLPIQGLCQTVDVMFDNQKVRELQYGMEDFEDADDLPESSGDEWDGDNDVDEDTYAW